VPQGSGLYFLGVESCATEAKPLMAQIKWGTEYDEGEGTATGYSLGRCPRCGCTFFEVRKTEDPRRDTQGWIAIGIATAALIVALIALLRAP
jgi:hypothetical protein